MRTQIVYTCLAGMLFVTAGCMNTGRNTEKDLVLKIDHYKAPCTGEGVRLCYRVEKEEGRTEFFYDEIEGFVYEWGYRYTISVEKKKTDTPVADASSLTYKLKKLYKKEKVAPTETFELPLRLNGQALVENREGNCSYFGAAIQTGSHSCAELLQGQTAVFHHRGDQPGLVLVRVQ